MRHKFLILVVAALGTTVGVVAAGLPPWLQEQIQTGWKRPPAPLTLEQKVKGADLIVRGKATLFGEEKWVMDFAPVDTSGWIVGGDPEPADQHAPFTIYERKLQIEVAEVLWPASLNGITNLVLNCYIDKKWPSSWWAYTNTPGVFFLSRGHAPGNKEWTRVDQLDRDDWIEPISNAAAIQAGITTIKARGEQPLRQ